MKSFNEIRTLLSERPEIINNLVFGETFLTSVSKFNDPDIINYLLDHGADPNIRNTSNNLPLTVACENGNIDVVKILIQKTQRSMKAFVKACEYGWVDTVETFFEHYEWKTRDGFQIFEFGCEAACKKGRIDVVEIFIRELSDIRGIFDKGFREATRKGYVEILKQILFRTSTTTNIYDRRGLTPLMIAVKCKQYECIDFLLDYTDREFIEKSLKINKNLPKDYKKKFLSKL